MIADFFTKPLQGVAFLQFRNLILSIDSPFDKAENHRSVLGKQASHNAAHHCKQASHNAMCHTMTNLAPLACPVHSTKNTSKDTIDDEYATCHQHNSTWSC